MIIAEASERRRKSPIVLGGESQGLGTKDLGTGLGRAANTLSSTLGRISNITVSFKFQ